MTPSRSSHALIYMLPNDNNDPNLCAKMKHATKSGEKCPPIIKLPTDEQQQVLLETFGNTSINNISPVDLVGRSYLQPYSNDDGTKHQFEIVKALKEYKRRLARTRSTNVLLSVSMMGGRLSHTMRYSPQPP